MRWGRLVLAGDAAHTVPPTGAKGLNLAINDVRILHEFLVDALGQRGSLDALDAYGPRALDRIWKSQNFSYWMTQMLHTPVDGVGFDRKRQLGELNAVVSSTAGRPTSPSPTPVGRDIIVDKKSTNRRVAHAGSGTRARAALGIPVCRRRAPTASSTAPSTTRFGTRTIKPESQLPMGISANVTTTTVRVPTTVPHIAAGALTRTRLGSAAAMTGASCVSPP